MTIGRKNKAAGRWGMNGRKTCGKTRAAEIIPEKVQLPLIVIDCNTTSMASREKSLLGRQDSSYKGRNPTS